MFLLVGVAQVVLLYIYSKLIKDLTNKTVQRVLVVATGSLLSPLSTLQKQSIPVIAHAVAIESEGISMVFLWAFIVGGLICVIGQLIMDVFKKTPGFTLSLLVVAGAVLDGFGLYEPLIDFAGAGATVPITSFGNSLVHGALQEAEQFGIIGVVTGMFEVTSAGISAAIIFAMIGALIFKPKG